MTQRTERLADLLRGELASLVNREMRDPRVRLATIAQVEVARDLSYAKVWVSALGAESDRQQTIIALENARGFLRRELAHRLDLRATPELHFELFRGAENSIKITELLDELEPGRVDETS